MFEIRSLTPDAPAYPPSLLELSKPPNPLWIRGRLPLGRCVAIVGSRRADLDAKRFARTLGRELTSAGIVVISGGAVGIDAAAHQGALDAGGATFVVQAAPLTAPYPHCHSKLFDAVLEHGGGWLSETPPDQPPVRSRFLSRNRLIAALADAVVVVQAPYRSGALSTARWARKLERPLFAVPTAPWSVRGSGSLNLLAEGASLCRSIRDIAVEMQWVLMSEDARSSAVTRRVPGHLHALLALLGEAPVHADVLARAFGRPIGELRAGLLELELCGAARHGMGGWSRVGAAI